MTRIFYDNKQQIIVAIITTISSSTNASTRIIAWRECRVERSRQQRLKGRFDCGCNDV